MAKRVMSEKVTFRDAGSKKMLEKFPYRNALVRFITQVYRFGIVGIIATTLHVSVFAFCIEVYAVPALVANLIAYGVAFTFGFSGHLYWTFSHAGQHTRQYWKTTALKYLTVSLIGLCLNSAVVHLVVNILGLSYMYAIALMVTLVPGTTFLLSKFWAFAAP